MPESYIHTKIGNLTLTFTTDSLKRIDFGKQNTSSSTSSLPATDIKNYFSNPKSQIKTKLAPEGTPFQQRVWQALTRIPCGQTRTYGDLAIELNTSARAIGNACRNNPIPILIPCHRVVAKTGLGGYAGTTEGDVFNRKVWLLKHEGIL